MPYRCILGCKDTNAIMHVFPNPAKFPERYKAWVDLVCERMEISLDVEDVRKKRICEIHFLPEHKNRCKRLSAIAMPMLNLPGIPLSRKTQNSDDSQPSSPFAASDVMDPQDCENQCGDMQTSTSNIEAQAAIISSEATVIKEHNYSVLSRPRQTSLIKGSKMAPLLYKLDASPPACAVRIVADIIGLQLDFKDPDISKMEHKSSKYLQLNPLGTIPILVDGDFVLSDSHAIMIYLLSKYGGDKAESLYPSDICKRGIVNQVMFFDTGILFIRIKVVALPTIMEGMKAPTEKHLHDLEEAYGMIEAYLSRNTYIAAEHLTIADLSVATTLAAAEAILSLNKDKFPLTAKWQELMQELPSFKKIATPGIAKFNVAMQYHWKKNNKQ